MLKINEIFYSIQGESSYVGKATLFIRLTACNLRCTYCDSKYSYVEGNMMSAEELIAEAKKYSSKNICITGGEPLLQKEIFPLMSTLCDLGYELSLETSGSKSIELVDPRVKIILDVKTPDSGAKDSFLMDNLKWLKPSTEFKFVVCSEEDLNWSEQFSRQHDIFENFVVLYSPSYGQVSERWLAEKILEKKSSARLQLQLHKYIWSPHERGV